MSLKHSLTCYDKLLWNIKKIYDGWRVIKKIKNKKIRIIIIKTTLCTLQTLAFQCLSASIRAQ